MIEPVMRKKAMCWGPVHSFVPCRVCGVEMVINVLFIEHGCGELVCPTCEDWETLEMVKAHYRRQGLGLCSCGEVIKGEGLCIKCSWKKLWLGEAE